MITIPPPPNVPTRVTMGARVSRFARVPSWSLGVIAIVTALGGGAGLKALFGQGEEQIRQGAEILAELKSQREGIKALRDRQDASESRERQNFQRNESSFATLFAALANNGYQAPRGVPEETEQVKFVPTKNAARPVRAAEQDGRELSIPEPAPPPPLR